MISIIVSVYNGKTDLKRCVESLIAQTDQSFEILLVDDGSTDSSSVVCDEFAEKYNNIRAIHKENGGLSSARLVGFHEATGDYVIFFDCDDFAHPELVERLQSIIEKADPDMILYDYNLVQLNYDIIPMSIQLPDVLTKNYDAVEFAVRSIAPGWDEVKEPYLTGFVWARCIKRDILVDELFISERICYTEDVLFNLGISRKLHRISYIRKPLYFYCVKMNSLTNKYRKNMWDMFLYRQKWIIDYCSKYSLLDVAANRIERSWWSAIMISVDNACMIKNYYLARKEIKRIVLHPIAQDLIYKKWKNIQSLSLGEKIKWILLALKMYRIYYFIKSQKIKKDNLRRNPSWQVG